MTRRLAFCPELVWLDDRDKGWCAYGTLAQCKFTRAVSSSSWAGWRVQLG